MFYHASPTANLKILKPRVSNHDVSQIYLSSKRENVLVYLSNAIEKFCLETGFQHEGTYYKWGPYGFDKNGIQVLEEYYPNAFIDTYRGVRGFIYRIKETAGLSRLREIPFVYTSRDNLDILSSEPVEDAYDELLKAERDHKIILIRFQEQTKENLEWIERTIKKEYQGAINHPEYRYFIKSKFKQSDDLG